MGVPGFHPIGWGEITDSNKSSSGLADTFEEHGLHGFHHFHEVSIMLFGRNVLNM